MNSTIYESTLSSILSTFKKYDPVSKIPCANFGRSKEIWNDFFFIDMSVLDATEQRKKDFKVLFDRKTIDPIGVAVGPVMYELNGFNIPKVHLPKDIKEFRPTGTDLGLLAPSSRRDLFFSPDVINAAMITLSKGYSPDTSYLWKEALKVLLTMTTDSLRFTVAKQFIAKTLELGKDELLCIPDDMKIITSNWNFISKQIWGEMYPIALCDSSYSGGPISKTEAYNMISLLSGDSEKSMAKPGDDPWANKRRSNRKNQLSSTVEKTTDLAIEASSFMLGSQNLDVNLIFTGSIAMGKTVLAFTAASDPKPVTLELGGKSLFIVCEDTDVGKAVELMYFALFCNQGRCCYAESQTSVDERICDEFLQKRAVEHVVGDQINNEQFEKIFKYMKSGVESGGTRLGSKGFYVQPTVFSGVQDMLIAQDNIFGPVQSISKFSDATSFGLAAGVLTPNIDVPNTLARALKAGAVYVNCFDVFNASMPFGGYKESH